VDDVKNTVEFIRLFCSILAGWYLNALPLIYAYITLLCLNNVHFYHKCKIPKC